jgi:hypothetical protein
MTVPEACNILLTYIQKQVNSGLLGAPLFIEDIFPEALTPQFTQDLIRELQSKVLQSNATAADIIGIQESLAFLGSIQRAEACRKCGRLQRLARAETHKRNLCDATDGALTLQLASIGSKVDSEFVADIGKA